MTSVMDRTVCRSRRSIPHRNSFRRLRIVSAMKQAGLSRRARILLLLLAGAIVMAACKTFPYSFAILGSHVNVEARNG